MWDLKKGLATPQVSGSHPHGRLSSLRQLFPRVLPFPLPAAPSPQAALAVHTE